MNLEVESKRLEKIELTDDNSNTKTTERNVNGKRESYIDWDEFFMGTAFLAAMRSKDPCSQVGACIVNDEKKIISIGYNGFPRGCSDDEFPWNKGTANPLDSKYMYVCHAEVNAVLNKNMQDVRGCTLYVGLFPCNECAKVVIQSGIKTIIYISDKYKEKVQTQAAKRMFDAAGVVYRQYIPKHKKIVIDFSDIDWNNMSQIQSP